MAGANNTYLPRIAAEHGDADGHEDPKAAEEHPALEERTANASETMPIAFRPPLPPMILLGGFGRPDAGAASEGDLASSTAPASLQTDIASVKADATLAKIAVVALPAVAAAALNVPLQGSAKTVSTESAVAQHAAEQSAKASGKAAEPRPVPASSGELAMKSPAGAASTNETIKPVAAKSALRPDAAASTTITRDSSHEKSASDRPGQAAPVTVLIRQNAPAPATPFPGLTAAPLLTVITADGSWQHLAAADLRALPAQNSVASAHSLKVQLHPAELGMVTASLRFSGEQLTVELQVESIEAQQRLSADSDTIVKSLRALGLEVDRVTIQQSTVAQTSNPRTDTNAGQNGQPASDRQSFNAAGSGGGNGQAGGQQSGRNTSDGAQASQNSVRGSADRAGGGLYI
ncbi:flagellar hook-length control protein FliK [Mesorhizobium sp. WSM2239]|uniref:Flagellar hook-length control protein FliK n=2 Tax=unclassified Mesorhizobium TaxID=325217 RepID=A0AAU8DBR4_9HYPH